MNLIAATDDKGRGVIINLDNVTRVDHYHRGFITIYFNFAQSNGFGEMPEMSYTMDGPEAEAFWQRLTDMERSGRA